MGSVADIKLHTGAGQGGQSGHLLFDVTLIKFLNAYIYLKCYIYWK